VKLRMIKANCISALRQSRFELPQRSGRFGNETGKCLSGSEFLPVPETSAERREPAAGGQVESGALSLPTFFGQAKKVGRRPGAKPRRVECLARDFLQLTRLSLALAVALSAVAGHLLAPMSGGSPWLTGAAVLLLAAGSSALNQVQEVSTDALMERTRNRPLPAGRLSRTAGSVIALTLLLIGLSLLSTTGGTLAALLGLLTVLLYNGAYTPMKKRTAFAILPGALCGALPPIIGWAAAGGDLSDPRIVLLAALFFLWQIPHFWHLALRWQDDYRRAGLPVLCDLFSSGQSRRILGAWIFSLLAGGLPFLLFGLLHHPPSRALAAATLLALAFTTLREFFRQNLSLPRMALQANFFIPLFTLALLTDRIFA
jgi:heme o synthase